MDISKTLPLAERVNAIRETWQMLVVRPDLDLSDEQLAGIASKLDAAIGELWKGLGAPAKQYEVSLFERCAQYLDIPEMPVDLNHPPICDRCKSVKRVRETMPEVFLCLDCEAHYNEEFPMEGVDFHLNRSHQVSDDVGVEPHESDLPF